MSAAEQALSRLREFRVGETVFVWWGGQWREGTLLGFSDTSGTAVISMTEGRGGRVYGDIDRIQRFRPTEPP